MYIINRAVESVQNLPRSTLMFLVLPYASALTQTPTASPALL